MKLMFGCRIDHQRFEVLPAGFLCQPVSTSDGRRVNALQDQLPCVLKQLSGQKHRTGRAVPGNPVLRGGGVDQHSSNGVLNFRRLQNRNAVVGHKRASLIVDEQFVLAEGAERGSHCTSEGHSSRDVVSQGISAR